MEVFTRVLADDAYLTAVAALADFLAADGVSDLRVCYGFGCDCPEEELYQEVPVPPTGLVPFIGRAVAAGYYRVGADNLHVTAPAVANVLLCHESDIHVESADPGFCHRLAELWRRSGMLYVTNPEAS